SGWRGDHGVNDARVAGSDGEVGLQNRRQPARELLPGGSAVGGLEDSAIRATERSVLVKSLLLLPQRRVHHAGIAGIQAHVVAAGVFVLEQHLLERGAAIGGA